MRRTLSDPARLSALWAGAIVAVVVALTLTAPGDVTAMVAAGVVVALLALGWYAHMRAVDRSFRIEVCVRPFGRIRL